MAYFPNFYGQNFLPQYNQAFPQTQQGASVIWVGSDMEAANYLMAPNSAVTLWNSNAPVVYLKQTDASGKPSLKIYDLAERSLTAPTAPVGVPAEWASKSDLETLIRRMDDFEAKYREGNHESV